MRRGRWKFKPSPSYGVPHPGMEQAKKAAEFAMSVYDAAPYEVRLRARTDCQTDIQWLYVQSTDPRPKGQRFSVPRDYKLPPFPWDDSPHQQFMRLFD